MDEEIKPEAENKPDTTFKKLTDSIPLFSAAVIILSLIKNFIFFNRYDISIKFYMGISELPLLIAEDLLFIIPIFFVMVWFDKIMIVRFKANQDQQAFFVYPRTIIAFIVCLAPVYYFVLKLSYVSLIVESILIIVLLFNVIIITMRKKVLPFLKNKHMGPLFFATIFMLLFMFYTTIQITAIDGGKYTGTKIITKDSTYTSTDSSYFIGQTSNYLFFYNKKDKHSTIIPASEVLKTELYTK
jgi:uncharacterized integral membrane protein